MSEEQAGSESVAVARDSFLSGVRRRSALESRQERADCPYLRDRIAGLTADP